MSREEDAQHVASEDDRNDAAMRAAAVPDKRTTLLDMPDGGRIALHRRCPQRPRPWPVILAHGSLSNHEAMDELGVYLTGRGWDCWMLDWAGHGQSRAARPDQDFEYPAFNDVPAAIAHVKAQTGSERVLWVSHSGGGHVALMHMARNPRAQSDFAVVVVMGAQATDAAPNLWEKFRVSLLWSLTRLLGRTPNALVRVGTEDEPTQLLAQWSRWNLAAAWRSADGFDYMRQLTGIEVPCLVVAGAADKVAPASGCRKIFEAVGGAHKDWLYCGVESGFAKDYSHGQMIRGEGARLEVFPKIAAWIEAMASRF